MSLAGVGFSGGGDGDLREPSARTTFAASLGVPPAWASGRQVHGAEVAVASGPGDVGDVDAIVTAVAGLPIAVFTADCLGVVLHGHGVVGVAHAGWRGLAAGVLEATVAAMEGLGGTPTRAAIGPAIGPCCYEVGDEVVAAVGHPATTTWGTRSVDLGAAAVDRLVAAAPSLLDVAVDGRCTRCAGDLHSHRADGTTARMVAVGWLP